MNKAKVFVVDDESVICWTLGLIIKSMGFATYTFIDPREALNAALTDCPDLLISDVTMPHMSGIELAIQMQMKDPRCKVLLVSGLATVQDLLLRARECGYEFPILKKPIPPEALIAAVRGYLNGSGGY
jgi:DNA-binding NtrC family response regulator